MDPNHPMLFLVLDGIPFDLARELWVEGTLPGFQPPRPLISAFPSLTAVALPLLVRRIYGLRPPGYEPRWYHPPTGEIRGGLHDPDFNALLDLYRVNFRGTLAEIALYGLGRAFAYGQIRWVTHRFNQDGGAWLGYLSGTDSIGHFDGRVAMAQALRDIFQRVRGALDAYEAEHGVRPGAVMCSDHGFSFRDQEHVDLKDLSAAVSAADLSAQPVGFGDVGAGVIYCNPEDAVAVAEAVAGLRGVDLALARQGDGCVVLAQREGLERARVEWTADHSRYTPVEGDPLGYGDTGWVDDDAFLESSWAEAYPWAMPRLRRGFTDLVQWPAQVLISMASGYTCGPALTYAAVQVRGGQVGTHGSLARDQSTGFFVSTEPREGTGPIPLEDAFAPWVALLRQP